MAEDWNVRTWPRQRPARLPEGVGTRLRFPVRVPFGRPVVIVPSSASDYHGTAGLAQSSSPLTAGAVRGQRGTGAGAGSIAIEQYAGLACSDGAATVVPDQVALAAGDLGA